MIQAAQSAKLGLAFLPSKGFEDEWRHIDG
jgi:hypothetical protein